MIKKDPLIKAKEDLERIVRDSNRNLKRAERAIENIKNSIYLQSEKISPTAKVNYDLMKKIAKKLYPRENYFELVDSLKESLHEGQVNTNREFHDNYYRLNVDSHRRLGEKKMSIMHYYLSLIDI